MTDTPVRKRSKKKNYDFDSIGLTENHKNQITKAISTALTGGSAIEKLETSLRMHFAQKSMDADESQFIEPALFSYTKKHSKLLNAIYSFCKTFDPTTEKMSSKVYVKLLSEYVPDALVLFI